MHMSLTWHQPAIVKTDANSCKRRLLSSFQSVLNGFHKAFQAWGVWEEDALQAQLLCRSSRCAACNGRV